MQNMACKDAWTVLKYLLGFPIAILLAHISYKDGPLDHSRQKITEECCETPEVCGPNSTYKHVYEDYDLMQINSSISCKGFDTEDRVPRNVQKVKKMNRPCEKCNEGRLSYQYRLGGWKPIPDSCVLQVIKDLERKAKALVVQDVPVFVAQLSNATHHHNQEITQSPVTVQTIVGILGHIADISQNTTINKPVMENFLKTVDILVSEKSKETWGELNNGNTTSNTSTELLRAIEDISSCLADDSFTINETSIELIRTVIENSYSGKSKLPNSATKILIPQVLKPTSLTIIVFTTLFHVLPTRDTSNNNKKSDVHINGDVVVIKVNETLNNISFTFDITDQSLGNAQCVFWNFSHDAWDSTGCEVKPYISKGNETSKIACECNHTTSFSILMSPFFIDDKALDYITFAGLGISVASLILFLIIETIIWKSVTGSYTAYMRHVCGVNIAVSLSIANICFITGATIVQPEELTPVGPCSVLAFFMHFFYLAYFFWMLCSVLWTLYRLTFVFHKMSRAKMMAIAFIIGYGVPLLIVVITFALTAGAGKYILEADVCWLNSNETKTLQTFVILALIIIAIDILIVIVVLRKVWTIKRDILVRSGTYTDSNRLLVISRALIILTPQSGLTWGFGIGTMLSPAYGVHMVFTLLNTLQGFFILAFGLLMDRRVRLREVLSSCCSWMRGNETQIQESCQRDPEQISLPKILVSKENVHHVSENDEHGDVNDSAGRHEDHGDSESRDLPESACPLPPNTDSPRDDDSSVLQNDEFEKNEEVVLIAQGLQEAPLSDSSDRRNTRVVTDSQAQELRAAFNCLICKGPFHQPMYAVCCQSLVACKVCVLQWQETSSQCPKCGEEDSNVCEVTGLTDALSVLRDIISVD
ncbi:hypothetical protein PO909_029702 [Leuciscus waleckii]